MFESTTVSLVQSGAMFGLMIRCHLSGLSLAIATTNESAMRQVLATAHAMQKQGELFAAIERAVMRKIEIVIAASAAA
ncbi:hypothetical protein [Aeromonas caviae]|uniref:hypothetical protein n=1 Tax=Aeromonas caviae TaxID=648 RepID=UPI0029D52C51|nr:hypothetical protein [Aeromonas caviae]MDX7711757.1 hypothetical protein [Aeromonas caviae]